MLNGLNHITIAVSDLERSFSFYVDLLGMVPRAKWDKGAYLSVGELWFCLSYDVVKPSQDYTHIAFDVSESDFPQLEIRLQKAGIRQWKQNVSEGDSLYILDPDGHKLELHSGTLEQRLDSLKIKPYAGLQWF